MVSDSQLGQKRPTPHLESSASKRQKIDVVGLSGARSSSSSSNVGNPAALYAVKDHYGRMGRVSTTPESERKRRDGSSNRFRNYQLSNAYSATSSTRYNQGGGPLHHSSSSSSSSHSYGIRMHSGGGATTGAFGPSYGSSYYRSNNKPATSTRRYSLLGRGGTGGMQSCMGGKEAHGGSSYQDYSIWDVCRAVEACDLESGEGMYSIDALAVPAILSKRGIKCVARSFGANLSGNWKSSLLGQRKPTLITFYPLKNCGVECGPSLTSALGSSSMVGTNVSTGVGMDKDSGTTFFIYENGIRREASSAQEVERFIVMENERCGERIVLTKPVRIEIYQSQIDSVVQILDLPDSSSTSTTGQNQYEDSHQQQQQSGGGHQQQQQQSGVGDALMCPPWVRKLCKNRPVITECAPDNWTDSYHVLPMARLEAMSGISNENSVVTSAVTSAVHNGGVACTLDISKDDDVATEIATETAIIQSNDMEVEDLGDINTNTLANRRRSKGGAGTNTCKARADLINYATMYHEKAFVNKVAPLWSKHLQQKLEKLNEEHQLVMNLDRNLETTIILARNAGRSMALCSNFLLEGSIRQNYSCGIAAGAGQTLKSELEMFASETPENSLPDARFGSWSELGRYYESIGKAHFFGIELSGGAALVRLLKECQASVLFAAPLLPTTMEGVMETLRKEISQCGGVGLNTLTWQDVVTKIFRQSTHSVMQQQIAYVTARLCWFLKKQKASILAWMNTLKDSHEEKWFSRLYSKDGELLENRREIQRAVFRTYDRTIDKCCQNFSRIYEQILSAIYGQPNNFLAKQVYQESTESSLQSTEEEFGRYVLDYISSTDRSANDSTTEGEKNEKKGRTKLVLRGNPKCKLKVVKKEIIVDLTKQSNRYNVVVGRNPAMATETIDDLRISSTHFGITLEKVANKATQSGNEAAQSGVTQPRIVLVDLSSNGTYLDGIKIGKGKQKELKVGSTIGVLVGNAIPEDERIFYVVEEYKEDIHASGSNTGAKSDVNLDMTNAYLNTTVNNDNADTGDSDNAKSGNDTSKEGSNVSTNRPKCLETDRNKRFASALSRVKEEMDVSRRSTEVVNKLNRSYDTSEVEKYLPTAANHILTAFLYIKRWFVAHIGLFAHAFLIKPLSNNLLEAMTKLEIEHQMCEGDANCSVIEEQLWKEHADRLNQIEVSQDKLYNALDLLSMHQRSIMRRRESLA